MVAVEGGGISCVVVEGGTVLVAVFVMWWLPIKKNELGKLQLCP